MYNFLISLIIPFALARHIFKASSFGERKIRAFEKIGFFQGEKNLNKSIWIHAVSVGEVNVALKLIQDLEEILESPNFILSTTTLTGAKKAKENLNKNLKHVYFPFDLKFICKKFISFYNPSILLLVETEIWPNLIDVFCEFKLPVVLVNGRLSDKSLKKYQRLSSFFKGSFNKIDYAFVQSKNDFERFFEAGVNKDVMSVSGSIKFDINLMPAQNFNENEINYFKEKYLFVCGSTHPGEEEILIDSFIDLKRENKHLVLAPRHPERFDEIKELVNKKNLSNILYTEISSNPNTKSDVTIVDVMGRLLDFYEIADCVFIGGTLVDHGGQNFLEPAFFSKPIISGRSTYNFDEISKKLSDLGLLKYVSNKDEISSVVEKIEAISDSLKKETNLWLNENRGASEFISKKVCKEFNLI